MNTLLKDNEKLNSLMVVSYAYSFEIIIVCTSAAKILFVRITKVTHIREKMNHHMSDEELGNYQTEIAHEKSDGKSIVQNQLLERNMAKEVGNKTLART